ncbi:MAG: hypothetical protein LBF68_03425 [Christensenellaceae bacterium]|jgi:hypothetical protein|nr:hypothetical protein [Christensenellaceae bacterium]
MRNLHKILIFAFVMILCSSILFLVSCSDDQKTDTNESSQLKSIEVVEGLNEDIIVNSKFPLNGKLKVTYNNDDVQYLLINDTMVENFNSSIVGEQIITISFANTKVLHPITIVNPIVSVTVDTETTTYNYTINQVFDVAYLNVQRTVGDVETIRVTSDMVTKFSTLKVGTFTVEIEFANITKSYDITVIDENPDSDNSDPGGTDDGPGDGGQGGTDDGSGDGGQGGTDDGPGDGGQGGGFAIY